MSLEGGFDKAYIDYPNVSRYLTGTWYSSNWVYTSSNFVEISFTSDGSVIRDGFEIEVGCRGEFSSELSYELNQLRQG